MTFPNCRSLEVCHHWATRPPKHTNLYLEGHQNHFRHQWKPPGLLGATDGLEKFESIVLERTPELNSSVLMQLFGNANSMAVNLIYLDLRFCNLDAATITKLLCHAPPNLRRFVLFCCDMQMGDEHLCPLIRQYSKSLVHFEYGAGHICRQLFFDDFEIEFLKQNGLKIESDFELDEDDLDNRKAIDRHAIREAIQDCRKRKRAKYRNNRVTEAINGSESQTKEGLSSSGLFGEATSLGATASKAQRREETLLDEEEEQRTRLIMDSRTRWFRRIIAWQGLCSPYDDWLELKIAVDLEEPGIDWVLISMPVLRFVVMGRRYTAYCATDKKLEVASLHANGSAPAIHVDMERAMREDFWRRVE